MSKNRILELMDKKLKAQGEKGIDAETTPTPQPAREVRLLPGSFDLFLQPEYAEPSPVEVARKERLAQTAATAAGSWTEQERIAAARARRDAILKR